MAQVPITTEEAMAFMNMVEARLSDQPYVYMNFGILLGLYKQQVFSLEEFTTKLGDLFKGYPDLITRFNNSIFTLDNQLEVPEDRTDEDDEIDR